MRYAPSFVVLLVVGCGGANARPNGHHDGAPLPIWTADAEGRPYPVPHVEVALNGHPVDVMLDTGASQHFVLGAAAWAYDVASRPFHGLATDAHGARFVVRLALSGAMRIPAHPAFVPRYLFLLESEPLYASGVLGGLSPQLLAPTEGTMMVDLPGGRMQPATSPPPLGRSARGRVCHAGADARDGYRFVVPVKVAGTTIEMLVDTGAQSTTLYEGSPLALTLGGERSARTVRIAGAASVVEMRVLEDVPFELGGAAMRGRLTIGPGDGQCGERGLLGFDLLRRCRMALGEAAMALSCDEADPPLHRARERRAEEPVVLTRIETPAVCGRRADELRPSLDAELPFRFRSAVEAYVALTPDIEAHAARIENACHDDGFLEAQVHAPLSRRGSELSVRFTVVQGRRFRVNHVTLSVAALGGSRRLSGEELPPMRTRSGLPYRHADVLADTRALADALTAAGAHVTEAGVGHTEQEDGTVDVYFAVALDDPEPILPG